MLPVALFCMCVTPLSATCFLGGAAPTSISELMRGWRGHPPLSAASTKSMRGESAMRDLANDAKDCQARGMRGGSRIRRSMVQEMIVKSYKT